MEEGPYLLKVDEITETCVGAEGKRWYRVRWKSTWIADDIIPPKIFQKTQNGKVHITGNNMTYEILDEKQNENGHVDFLLSCKDSWESEEKLKGTFYPSISIYWASKTKAKELIKIEDASDEENQSCCMMKMKAKPTERVMNLIPEISPIKEEKDVENQNRFSQCCSNNDKPNLSSGMDLHMRQLNLSANNLYTADVTDINENLKSNYDGQQLTSPNVLSPNICPSSSSSSGNFTHNNIKPEDIYVNNCRKQSVNEEPGNKSPSPTTFLIKNSLSDACDLPADRFSPKIIKIEDDYSLYCENQSINQSEFSLPDLNGPNQSISPSRSTTEGVTGALPGDLIKSNSMPRNHATNLSSYNLSSSLPDIIKIEDDDEHAQCEQRSLHQNFLLGSPSEHKEKLHNAPGFPVPNSSFSNNSQLMSANISCKTEPESDYPINNNDKPSTISPYPLVNGRCSNPPDLVNFSPHLPTPGQFPQSMCKDEDKFNSSCQQRQSFDQTRLLGNNNRPGNVTPIECSRSLPENPPSLIPNGMAVPHVSPNMNRYGEGFNIERNGNRLSHHNHVMSNIPGNDKRRYHMVNDIDHKCDICGKLFTDFNTLYEHRISHGNDHLIPPIMKIKEEKDLEYRRNEEGCNFVKEPPSKDMMRTNQNPYFPTNNHHIPPTFPHNISRNEEAYLASVKQSKQFSPRIPNTHNFRFQANCNVQSNHIMYPTQNQYMASNGHEPPTLPHLHTLNKNKESFYPNQIKPPNNPKQYVPEQLHGVPNTFKPPQREIPTNNRDPYMSVNGHDVPPPHPYAHTKVPNHRHPQMGINTDDDRLRNNDPVQFFPGTAGNSYLPMNEHMMGLPQGICKPGECSSCVTHDPHPHPHPHPHPQMVPNPGVVRPHQINPVESHRFRPGPNPYILPNRHMHPGNFSRNQGPQNICKVVPDKPPTNQQQQHMQMMPNPSQMRYQNISAVTNRQFYPSQSQPYLPPNLNNHIPNTMPPTLTKMPENTSPKHNELPPSIQHGPLENLQMASTNYLKCDLCGKQFPDYVTLSEHRASHVNKQLPIPRGVQIKEEPDTDFMPMPNNNFRKDVPSDYMYPLQNTYMPGNVHRHPINPSNPSNDFPSNICKDEGPNQNPQISLGSHGVNNSGIYNIHQSENVSRIHAEQQQQQQQQQQQHNQFIPNPDPSMNPNPSMGDPRQIPPHQNPYLMSNGHILPNNSYPPSNNCKTEDKTSTSIISKQPLTQEASNQNSNATTAVEKTHKCDTCGETFTDYSKLKDHRKTHANEKQFSCELCDKTFTQNSTLKRHQRTHTREKPYKCEICGKSFSHNYNLKEHGKTHTGEKPYRCDICGKTFAQNYHLKEHQTTHSDAKPFKCDKCNKQFSLDSYLKKHQKIHTGEKPYKCDVCDKQFLQNSHLKDHRRIHTGEKPFKCEICGIRFSQNYTLKIHQRTHTGEKPYKCEICEKRFSQNSHLKEHRTRTHSGDKPFKCDQCHKEFSLDSYLKKHQKIHSGEKPFKCDICEKQFSQNYHLKEHRRIHTGEKPYKCQICEMRFSQNCSLKIHQRIHTGEKPYECEICGKQFSHSSNVKTHKRVHLTEKAKATVNQSVLSVSYPLPGDTKVNILPSDPEIPPPVIAPS